MNRMNMYQPTYEIQRDPGTAAMLSIIPGLGQLYNGERRKGVLFLDVAAINFLMLWLMLFTDPIIKAMNAFGTTFHVQPNPAVVASLKAAHIGSPLSIIVLGLIVTFAAYAVRDAYDKANVTRRRKIYPDMAVEMPEAASGSYLFHFAAMISFFVLALFFVQPVKQPDSVIEFEFVYEQPEVKHQVKDNHKSDHNSENAGQVNPRSQQASQRPNAPSRQQSSQRPADQPPAPVPTKTHVPNPQPPAPVRHQTTQPQQIATLPLIKPVPVNTPLQPTMPIPRQVLPHPPAPTIIPQITSAPNPPVAPMPATQAPRVITTAPLPTMPVRLPQTSPDAPQPVPTKTSVSTLQQVAVAPQLMSRTSGAAPSVPVPTAPRATSSTHTGIPGPAPTTIAFGSPAGTVAGPVPVLGRHTGTRSADPGATTGIPAPSRMDDSRTGGGTAGSPTIAVAPRPGSNTGTGQPGAPVVNTKPNAPGSTRAQKDVDFGAYMNELQRRIKRNWSPPKELETKRVMVIFTIRRDGSLLNLQLQRPSGSAIADNAALKAVQQAVPFAALPDGAPESVDIQFTFDYNVFGGHAFRNF